MNILKMADRFFKDRQGNGNAVIGLIIVLMISMIFFLLVEIGHLYISVQHIKNDLDFANMAVWKELNQDQLAYGIYQFHNEYETPQQGLNRARETFMQYLSRNAGLNPFSFKPIPTHPLLADDPVQIIDFRVYLKDDLPVLSPEGKTIDKISVYSRIRVKIKTLFSMFGEGVVTDVGIISNLEDDL